jgi:hypothetical protein
MLLAIWKSILAGVRECKVAQKNFSTTEPIRERRMHPVDIAREKVLAASCRYVGGRLERECREPGAYDDAQQEMDGDLLNDAVNEYAKLLAENE